MATAAPERYTGIVLVSGDEEFLVGRAIEQVSAAARRHDPDAELVEKSGAEVVTAELYEMLSPSLFGGERTVILRQAQDILVAAMPAVLSFVNQPAEDITLVIQHAGGAKGKALHDAARKAATQVITCAKITKPGDRQGFVRDEVRRARATISPDAAAALLDAVGTDLRELAAVIAQLASDCGGKIDAPSVAAYHKGRAQVTGFTIADLTVAGNTAGAVENLRWALSIGVAPVLIADALADGIRSIAKVSGAGNGNSYALAGKLGMAPWKVERAQREARWWSEPALRAAMVTVAELNADVKGNAADPDFALERAIRSLAESRTPARRR